MKNKKSLYHGNKDFVKIDSLFYEIIGDNRVRSSFYKCRISQNWETVLSGFLAGARGQTKVIDFKNGVLVVACLSKSLAYEIKILAARIVYDLNKLLKTTLVESLCVEV